MAGYRAAIDFGTSYTIAASQSGAQAVPVAVPLVEEGKLASAVGLDESGTVQAGPSVEQMAALTPERVERTPKRCLDQPDVMLGRTAVTTVDLVAAVLGYVREELHRYFNGVDPDELFLTHPARWEPGDPRMRRLEAAAQQVGFGPPRMMPEPCAAALALAAAGQLEVGQGELVAVYDLGGGTFDTALLNRTDTGGFVLVGEPGGDPELGGEWLDDRLFERLSGQLPGDDEASLRDPDGSPDPVRWRRAGAAFRQEIRKAKERLARETSVRIPLNPPFTQDSLSLSRAELERTATPLITKSADRFDLFLQRNGITAADLAAICLVGGSSRLTVVNRILGNRFERPIATHGDPKALTALGALSETPAAAGRLVTPVPAPVKQPVAAEASASVPAAAVSSSGPSIPPSAQEPSSSPRPDGRSQLDALYDDAVAALWTEQFDRAVELLEQVVAAWPDHPTAGDKLSQAKLSQAKLSQAKLGQAKQSQPTLAAVTRTDPLADSYRSALRMLDASEWRGAADLLARIARDQPGYRDTQALLARARRQIGELAPPGIAVAGILANPLVVSTLGYPVSSVAFSSDGRLFAASRYRGSTRVWETSAASELRNLMVEANVLVFSADSRWLVSCAKMSARIWDIATGQQQLFIEHGSKRRRTVALSRDRKWLAVAGPSGSLQVRDTVHGSVVSTISLGAPAGTPDSAQGGDGAAFSTDGRRLAAGAGDRTARIWEIASGELLVKVTHAGEVRAVAFSPADRWLATGSADGTACVWDARNGEFLTKIIHGNAVGALAFSPDGLLLATASADQTARVWEVATGRLLATVRHSKPVLDVAFSPGGDRLATASHDCGRIWALSAASPPSARPR
jgi:hypothetical protein